MDASWLLRGERTEIEGEAARVENVENRYVSGITRIHFIPMILK